jgi:UDP-N-acetylmuramate dehydrogenase
MRHRPTLAGLTTLRVGGRVEILADASNEEEIIDSVWGADELGTPLLVLGGGSNIVVSDEGFPGVVVRDRRTSIVVEGDASSEAVLVTVAAGTPWDDLVIRAVDEGWVGIEAMSGIPGSTGATPVQNVGAYGQEVAAVVASVKAWDRVKGGVITLTRDECAFAYRDSLLKRSMRGDAGDGQRWRPTPRFVVLDVTFRFERGGLSAPVRYGQLAEALGVDLGERAPLSRVREEVLQIRRSKGMVLDPDDHDTWSVGSFFTNPLLTPEQAGRLPKDAPRYPLDDSDPSGPVKTSAAWLLEHAGFGKGYSLEEGAPASLSTKHALALTNRGGASAADIVALARHVREGVREAYGVTLEPEPVLVGLEL